MSNIAQINHDQLMLDKAPIPEHVATPLIMARHERGKVILLLNDKKLELTTVVAHRIGVAIGTTPLYPGEMWVLKINGHPVDLMPDIAIRLSTALLRKADAADDWQINNARKLT